MSNFILISIQVSNFIQTQSIEGGGGRGGGVETCQRGGGPLEEDGGMQMGRCKRPSGAGGMQVGRWRREAGGGARAGPAVAGR
jgi:hypothetical protein